MPFCKQSRAGYNVLNISLGDSLHWNVISCECLLSMTIRLTSDLIGPGCPIDEPVKGSNPEIPLERDAQLLQVLDRMILYLRVVHSFDYYSCAEYPNEDMMPNRCGIIHARGLPPTTKITQNDCEWTYVFQCDLQLYFQLSHKLYF